MNLNIENINLDIENLDNMNLNSKNIMNKDIKSITLSFLFFLVVLLSASQANAFQSFEIKRIRIQGLQRVSEAAVLNDIPVQVGQTLNESEASEIIRSLYQTGFFKDVSLARENDTLVIKVEERPFISKLTLVGVKDKDKVQKLIRNEGLCEGRMYDPTVVARTVKALEKHYFSRGKYGVKIESSVTFESPSLAHVQISIYEGDVARIRQIKIIGNCVFEEKDLLKDFHSCKTNMFSWFSNDDQYAKEKLNADLETLRSYYMDRGYIHFQIDSTQVSLTPNKQEIYITIQITEGEKYTFGDVVLSGRFVVPEQTLQKRLCPIQAGTIFSRKKLLEVKQDLEDEMGEIGYAQAEANLTPQVDEATKTVNINFDLNPGKRVYVRRIQFKGNVNTKDEVLRRELPQMEGTWISTGLVKEGKEKILRRGFASDLEIETIPVDSASDQVDINYKLEEARMGQVGAGLGYSATERLMFNFNVSQENFFGTGNMVEFTFDKSKSWSNYAFNYQDPYFTIDGIGMGVGAYYSKAELSKTSFISDYITDSFGTELRFALPISKYEALSATVGYDNTRLKVNADEALEIHDFIKRYGTKFNEYVFGLGWGYNSLNQPIFPTRGLTQSAKIRVAGPYSDQRYYKATYDMAWFYPITESERWIINVSSSLGYGDGLSKKTRKMPFYRNFYAGGTRLVRGFEENSLGPRDSNNKAFGGNVLAAGSIALIFPNPIKPDAKSIRTSLFLDAGQVYDTHFRDKLLCGYQRVGRPNGMRFSVGLSLAWHSPLGAPITFSVAKPINAKPGDDKRSFTFWMGTQF